MRDSVVKVDKFLSKNMASHIVNIVHDEIVIDADEEEINRIHLNVPGLMTRNEVVSRFVSIGGDTEISHTNWADKKTFY